MDPLQAMSRIDAPWPADGGTAATLPPAELLTATVSTLIGLLLPAVERMRKVTARMGDFPRLAPLGAALDAFSTSRRNELWEMAVALSGRCDVGAETVDGCGPQRRVEIWLAALCEAAACGRALCGELDRLAGEAGAEERRLLAEVRTDLGVVEVIEGGAARALARAFVRGDLDAARAGA